MIYSILSLLLSFSYAADAEKTSRIEFAGDLRFRLVRQKESVNDERRYQQLRLRFGARADVNEDMKAILRLATATSAVSSNQTLGDSSDPAMARRSFGIDLAYLDWKLFDNGSLWLGRTAVPFWSPNKVQTVWDSDLAFEGVTIRWEPKWSHSGLFAVLGSSMIYESYNSTTGEDSVDTARVGGQFGHYWKGENWTLTVHVANYYFLNMQNANIKRFTTTANAKVDAMSAPFTVYRGNSVYLKGTDYFFTNEYILIETGVEWKHKPGALEYVLFADFVRNDGASSLNRAVEAGGGVKWQKLSVGAAFVEKEADSVVAAFSDTDSSGGGTDNRGARFWVAYQVSPGVNFSINHFEATRGVNTVDRQYSGSLVDLMASF